MEKQVIGAFYVDDLELVGGTVSEVIEQLLSAEERLKAKGWMDLVIEEEFSNLDIGIEDEFMPEGTGRYAFFGYRMETDREAASREKREAKDAIRQEKHMLACKKYMEKQKAQKLKKRAALKKKAKS